MFGGVVVLDMLPLEFDIIEHSLIRIPCVHLYFLNMAFLDEFLNTSVYRQELLT